jgi:PhzF family phenazine biosynthesis protein
MKLPLDQLDAFTDRVFGGNPAAVVTLERWLDDATLQAIAAENNLAETAFVIPRPTVCPLRWFTPTLEVDLCGHATLAAAHVLFERHFPDAVRLAFETRSGLLGVDRDGDVLSLDFPSRPGDPVALDEPTARALGVRCIEARKARDLMVVLESQAAVLAFVPDHAVIAALDAFALIVTAPGDDVDFVSRFFAPGAGVPEDPVTGSAHCTLIPYWAARLGKSRLTARQLSARGGELACELRGDRVKIGGKVAPYLAGVIDI